MRKKAARPFVTDWDEQFCHTLPVDQKNKIFLREVTLLENSLQRFLALKPSLANKVLSNWKGNEPPFLERVVLTRDKINELLGVLASQKGPNRKWKPSKLAPGSRGEVTLTIQSFMRGLTQSRNGIEALIREKNDRLVPLKKLIPSYGELGGRLLGVKRGLNDVLEQTPIVHTPTSKRRKK